MSIYQNFFNADIRPNCIGILKDGKIACLTDNNTFIIFNRKNYIIEKKYSLSDNKIENKNSLVEKLEKFSQLNNSNLVIFYRSIYIYKIGNNSINLLYKLLGHKEGVDNVIEAKNKKLISSSRDKSFKIWEFQKSQKNYICINTILHGKDYHSHIEFIKDDEFIFISNVVRFYEYKNPNITKKSVIDKIDCTDLFAKINKVGFIPCIASNGINVIDLDKRKLLYIFKTKDMMADIHSIIKLNNDNLIIVGFQGKFTDKKCVIK
jgi:WD40 repeat protein